MADSGETNFGVKFNRMNDSGSYVSAGNVKSIDFPGVSHPAVSSTHHGSTMGEYIKTGLPELSEFKVTLNYVSANATDLLADTLSSGSRMYQIDFPMAGASNWSFPGLVTNFKNLAADPEKPEAAKLEITIRPTCTSGSTVFNG